MIDVIIPMAGEGRRFAEAGYEQPKPLIDVAGKPMIERAMECLRPAAGARFVLVSRIDLPSVPGDVVTLTEATDGAVDTVRRAADLVAAGPVLVANCDQYVTVSIDGFLDAVQGADAAVMVFNSTNPHHSYVKVSGGLVTEIAEKRVISDQAVVGVYWFADSGQLFDACRVVLAHGRRHDNGEFYLSSVLGLMVDAGFKVATYEVDVRDKHMLGTPEELRIFLDKVADGRVVLP